MRWTCVCGSENKEDVSACRGCGWTREDNEGFERGSIPRAFLERHLQSFEGLTFQTDQFEAGEFVLSREGLSAGGKLRPFSSFIAYRFVPENRGVPVGLLGWMLGVSAPTGERSHIELFWRVKDNAPPASIRIKLHSCRVLDKRFAGVPVTQLIPAAFHELFRQWIAAGNALAKLPAFDLELWPGVVHFDGAEIRIDRTSGVLRQRTEPDIVRFPLDAILGVFTLVESGSYIVRSTVVQLDRPCPTTVKELAVEDRTDALRFNTGQVNGLLFIDLCHCALALRFVRGVYGTGASTPDAMSLAATPSQPPPSPPEPQPSGLSDVGVALVVLLIGAGITWLGVEGVQLLLEGWSRTSPGLRLWQIFLTAVALLVGVPLLALAGWLLFPSRGQGPAAPPPGGRANGKSAPPAPVQRAPSVAHESLAPGPLGGASLNPSAIQCQMYYETLLECLKAGAIVPGDVALMRRGLLLAAAVMDERRYIRDQDPGDYIRGDHREIARQIFENLREMSDDEVRALHRQLFDGALIAVSALGRA